MCKKIWSHAEAYCLSFYFLNVADGQAGSSDGRAGKIGINFMVENEFGSRRTYLHCTDNLERSGQGKNADADIGWVAGIISCPETVGSIENCAACRIGAIPESAEVGPGIGQRQLFDFYV